MNEFKHQAQRVSPEIYQQFKHSLETGKWPDGKILTEQQRGIVMEAIILYEHANLPEDQHVGQMSDQCASKTKADDDTQPLSFH